MAGGSTTRIVLRPCWRSQWKWISIFLVASFFSVVISRELPFTVIRGELFRFFNTRWMLDLPIFWFLPFAALLKPLYNIYNVAYVFFARGIEAREGIISLHQKITRIRYEDVRVVEVHQTLLGRILGYGRVEIGTAASEEVEINLNGVSRPALIQDVIVAERDRIQRARKQKAEMGDSSESSTLEQQAV